MAKRIRASFTKHRKLFFLQEYLEFLLFLLLYLSQKIFIKRQQKKKKKNRINNLAALKPVFKRKKKRGRKKRNQINFKIPDFISNNPRQFSFSIASTLLIIFLSYGFYDYIFKGLPRASDLITKQQDLSTQIFDRNGQLLYKVYKDENRTIVPLKNVSQDLINATVAIEDKTFYDHLGFSLKGIFRAIFFNFQGKTFQGGSTITQQLIKNRLLTSERTLQRKIREVVLAILVEGTFTKDEILEMYLNQVPYGGSIHGIEAAAHQYFNKKAKDLTLAESALLAGLPQAPSIYSPYGPHPERAILRREEVLRRMVEDGYITEEQASLAKKEEIIFHNNTENIKAPHFVMYLKEILAEKYGEDLLNTGGLQVKTSLDYSLQVKAQEIIEEELSNLRRLNVKNAALMVTNPQTGEILAMIGSQNYFDFEHDGQVNVCLRPRQPGSSIKPLTYAVAFEKGYTPSVVIEDSPITYQIVGGPAYSPKNYDGKFHGRVTVREALANSYNIPAVKTLAYIGIDNLIDKAEAIGISTWSNRKRFGLSLTLGGGEVLMSEMTKVYGTFANNGVTLNLNPILEVRDHQGKLLYENKCAQSLENCDGQRNFDEKVAYYINDILSDNKARSAAFGERSLLYIPGQDIAVKTGTTNNLRDNWTIGYSSNRLVAVWVGNNDNSPMSHVASGVTGASPIWNKTMRLLLDENNPHHFAISNDYIKVKICKVTNTLPCSACPIITEEIYKKGDEPVKACNNDFFIKKETTPGEREKIL